jgi:DNA-binding response OmpR family regulator
MRLETDQELAGRLVTQFMDSLDHMREDPAEAAEIETLIAEVDGESAQQPPSADRPRKGHTRTGSIILLTNMLQPAGEVLPALHLSRRNIQVAPAEISALVDLPNADVILVDARRDLPQIRSLCRLLRSTGIDCPLIVIVTEDSLAAVTAEWGIDEMLLDTASPAEAEARLQLATGRLQAALDDSPMEIRNGDLSVDEATYTAKLKGRVLDLTFKEFELLKYLAQHPGQVLTRAQLVQEVWGYDYFGGSRTVDVHIRRLRAKLGAENEQLIGTVRNVGYCFVADARNTEFAADQPAPHQQTV